MDTTVGVSSSLQAKKVSIQKVGAASKLRKEYNITSGKLTNWINSANEINGKICKRQYDVVMKEVDADKKHMNKNIDNCEIVTTDLTSPILKTVFKCYCNYRFIRDCHIFRHLRYEDHDKNISQKNVNSHIKNHEIETSVLASYKMDDIDNNYTFYTCKFCDQSFTHLSAIRRHTHRHTAKRKFICFVCGDKFILKSTLNDHIHSQHNKENNICKPCGYVFNNKLDCNIHINNCQSDPIKKPHKCNYCGHRFKRKDHLTNHIHTHTGERPYSCPECGDKFSDITALKRHILKHTGEKPFLCEYCARRFNRLGSLNRHIKNIHFKEM